MPKVGQGTAQFMLRLPDGMRDRIKGGASENGRSMNSEIVATLEEKYPPVGDMSLVEATQNVAKMGDRFINHMALGICEHSARAALDKALDTQKACVMRDIIE